MKVALYARVSMALRQDPENQLRELRAWAERTGAEVEGVYVDETSSRDTRPKKEEVLKKLRMHEIQGVVFWKFDRWGRTMAELVRDISDFVEMGWLMVSTTEGFDITTPAGRLLAHELAGFANFERDLIHERVMSGLKTAKSRGKIDGRHPRNCGCGKVTESGKVHDGWIKPLRNEHNQLIGWINERNGVKTFRGGFSEEKPVS